MATIDSSLGVPDPSHDHGANHDPHLAHHFDTREQQFQSAKLGMWTFLGTEVLMFGGLFCAYSVYRHNHPDVFAVAHEALNRWLGAVNTIVLITSSLTMAWAVRASQLSSQTALKWLLGVTIIGGYVFLGIKAIEYNTKWQHKLFIGPENSYYRWTGEKPIKGYFSESAEGESGGGEVNPEAKTPAGKEAAAAAVAPGSASTPAAAAAAVASSSSAQPAELPPGAAVDGNAGTADEAKIAPNWADPKGVAAKYGPPQEAALRLDALTQLDKKNVYTFFAIYFFMTGLHGVHVVLGMSLIYWILLRAVGPRGQLWLIPAAPISVGLFLAFLGIIIGGTFWGPCLIGVGVGLAVLGALWAAFRTRRASRVPVTPPEFGPDYFTPVDLVGLYWHLVDIIWIFLFPLLYLIH
jgi:cytochrome c oxidase subunit 3